MVRCPTRGVGLEEVGPLRGTGVGLRIPGLAPRPGGCISDPCPIPHPHRLPDRLALGPEVEEFPQLPPAGTDLFREASAWPSPATTTCWLLQPLSTGRWSFKTLLSFTYRDPVFLHSEGGAGKDPGQWSLVGNRSRGQQLSLTQKDGGT